MHKFSGAASFTLERLALVPAPTDFARSGQCLHANASKQKWRGWVGFKLCETKLLVSNKAVFQNRPKPQLQDKLKQLSTPTTAVRASYKFRNGN